MLGFTKKEIFQVFSIPFNIETLLIIAFVFDFNEIIHACYDYWIHNIYHIMLSVLFIVW